MLSVLKKIIKLLLLKPIRFSFRFIDRHLHIKRKIRDKLSRLIDERIELPEQRITGKMELLEQQLEIFTKTYINQLDYNTEFIKNLIPKFLSAAAVNRQTFLPFKNYCKGKKLVICGGGPTLSQFQPIEDAVYIALNRAVLFDKVNFDFIYAQDWEGIKAIQNELINYRPDKCQKLLGLFYLNSYNPDYDSWVFSRNIPEDFAEKCSAKRFITDIFVLKDLGLDGLTGCDFVLDIDNRPVGSFPNVALSAIQFALYMNPSKIYLAGIDQKGGYFNYSNLTPDEASNIEKIASQTYEHHMNAHQYLWRKLKAFAKTYYPDTEIISVNPVGLKGIFKDWYQDEGGMIK